MDETIFSEEEHIPECVEMRLAYDLAAIPILGVFFYVIIRLIIDWKLGSEADFSYWLIQSKRRLWKYTGLPITILFVATLVLGVVSLGFALFFLENQKCGESSGVANLKSIVTAQATYTTQYKRYAPSLAVLASSGILRRDGFENCTAPGKDSEGVDGYIFQMTAGIEWDKSNFYVRCRLETPHPDAKCYATNVTGKIVTTAPYK